jgi:hypothetical protein
LIIAQKPSWTNCNNGLQCARVKVPLDYSQPKGAAISLAVQRRRAESSSQRIGPLLVNPGGPGVPGTQLTEQAALVYSSTKNVGMILVIHFLAVRALVTAIDWHAVFFKRLSAIQSFRQRAGEVFQLIKLMAGKKIPMRQAPARQRTLKQLDAWLLAWKTFE